MFYESGERRVFIMQEIKNKILENLALLDKTITKEDIENASNEQLLKYLDLTEKIKARLEVLEIKGGEE